MSKIICEVCGTSYPESATQCPICGCVRSGEANAVSSTSGTEPADSKSYTYVKGGRFSKSNVKKRNRAQQVAAGSRPPEKPSGSKSGGSKIDKGLTIAVIVLLLAIIAVVLYIVVNFFGIGIPDPTEPSDSAVSTTAATQPSTEATEPPVETTGEITVACTALSMDDTTVTLEKVGAAVLLNVYTEPENTTDEMSFVSSDESVATVTGSGKVVAVGKGQATITITCGEAQLECTVICDVEEEPTTEPATEPSTEPSTEPESDFELNRSDFTLAAKGESWVLYNGSIGKTEITWSSDDETIATVENGKVVAVGSGVTKVHAEYNGTKLSCIVRCSFTEEKDPVVNGNGGVSEDGANASTGPYTISHTDVTIAVNESFNLVLNDANGNPVTVNWIIADSTVCTVDGSKITGKASGYTKVYTQYADKEFSCTVRVKGS